MKPIEIFRAGTHTAMNGESVTITTADLAACAKSYDRRLAPAPIVVGHPKTNAPAYGWAEGLEVRGDILVARPHEVDAQFEQMVKDGRFKNRSASFYRPNDPANPRPGSFYLKHIGFLGAAAPAVQGLKEVQFAADSNAVEFADWNKIGIVKTFGRLRDWMIGQHGQEVADQVLPADELDSMMIDAAQPLADRDDSPSFTQTSGDDVTTEAEKLAAEKAQLDKDRLEFAQRQKAAREANFTAFVDSLIAGGKLATGHKAPLIAFMSAIPAEGENASFEFAQADGTRKTADATEWFQGFLKGLPNLVPMGQRAPHDVNFAQPGEQMLDSTDIYAIHNRTKK